MESVARKLARLVTVKELAELLAVPPSWVYEKASRGGMPHVKVGRYVRFDVDNVIAWLEKGR